MKKATTKDTKITKPTAETLDEADADPFSEEDTKRTKAGTASSSRMDPVWIFDRADASSLFVTFV